MRLKSLETNWLRNIDRTIPIPECVWYPMKDCGGKYYHPQKGWMYDADGKPYHMKYGVIVVSTKWPERAAQTIAHEWRHHWQYWNGIKFETVKMNPKKSYWAALEEYFSSSRTEMDALRFEYKMAGIHEAWEEFFFDDCLSDLKPKKIWVSKFSKPIET